MKALTSMALIALALMVRAQELENKLQGKWSDEDVTKDHNPSN